MSLSQTPPVVPPVTGDKGLKNFAQVIQSSFYALYQAAHIHRVITVAPSPNDGTVGDIYLFDDKTNIYIYIKTPRGWARTSALTLI